MTSTTGTPFELTASDAATTDFEAILFDLDGTLVDSAGDLAEACKDILPGLGGRELTVDEVRRLIGRGVRALLTDAFPISIGRTPSPQELDGIQARFADAYARCNGTRSHLFPGAATTLARLRSSGFKLAVVSNKPIRFIQPLLESLGLDKVFDTLVGGDSTPALKPDPLPLLHACRMLHAQPMRTLMVGDSAIDVTAARAAGCAIACVTHGYACDVLLRSLDIPLLESLSELPGWLSHAATRFHPQPSSEPTCA